MNLKLGTCSMCIYNKNSWGFSSRPSKAYGFTDLKIKHLEAGAHTTKNSWGFSSRLSKAYSFTDLKIKHLEAGAHTTKNSWGFSSAGRAPALHAGGQEFESPNLHQ